MSIPQLLPSVGLRPQLLPSVELRPQLFEDVWVNLFDKMDPDDVVVFCAALPEFNDQCHDEYWVHRALNEYRTSRDMLDATSGQNYYEKYLRFRYDMGDGCARGAERVVPVIDCLNEAIRRKDMMRVAYFMHQEGLDDRDRARYAVEMNLSGFDEAIQREPDAAFYAALFIGDFDQAARLYDLAAAKTPEKDLARQVILEVEQAPESIPPGLETGLISFAIPRVKDISVYDQTGFNPDPRLSLRSSLMKHTRLDQFLSTDPRQHPRVVLYELSNDPSTRILQAVVGLRPDDIPSGVHPGEALMFLNRMGESYAYRASLAETSSSHHFHLNDLLRHYFPQLRNSEEPQIDFEELYRTTKSRLQT